MARPTNTQMSLLDAIADMEQREDPDIGFPPLVTAMSLMPGTKPPQSQRVWAKRSGRWSATWTAGTKISDGSSWGLPWGPKGRLWVAYLGGKALRNHHPMVELPASKTAFMRDFGLAASGGTTGSKDLVGDGVRRLVRANLIAEMDQDTSDPDLIVDEGTGMRIAQSWSLWWDRSDNPTHPVKNSYILLDPLFYELIQGHPLPLNLDALRILAGSALAQDLYSWLTYRLRQLTKPTTVTWEQLTVQFGKNGLPAVGTPNSARSRAVSETKRNIRAQLPTVLAVYHKAKVVDTDRGLMLHPSPPHVPERGGHGLRRADAAASLPARRKEAAAADARRQPVRLAATSGTEAPQLPAGRSSHQ